LSSTGRDDVLIRLLTESTWRNPYLANAKVPAAMALHDWRLFDRETLLSYPPFTSRWHSPMSVLLREDLREPLAPFLADDQDYEEASDGYDYRAALVLQALGEVPGAHRPAPGNFIGERKCEWVRLVGPSQKSSSRPSPTGPTIPGRGGSCLAAGRDCQQRLRSCARCAASADAASHACLDRIREAEQRLQDVRSTALRI
jgi:hypothetical protein